MIPSNENIEVRFDFPKHWQKAYLPSDYRGHSPERKGIWGNYQFRINEYPREADIWLVQGNVDNEVICKAGVAIFITSEEASNKSYHPAFLEQFDYIITSRRDIIGSNVIRTHYICPWQIKKSYDELIKEQIPVEKSLDLSAVVSDLVLNEGHKKRYAFVNQLKGHFKEQLHWFGKGNREIENKFDGVAPFRYSIAIENSVHAGYFTEKITDCFLSWTMPIYYGCPDIDSYFPEESFIKIDINDLQSSIHAIETAIRENYYTKNLDALREARDLVLKKYQFFPTVTQILSKHKIGEVKRIPTKKIIKPEENFMRDPILMRIARKVLGKFKQE